MSTLSYATFVVVATRIDQIWMHTTDQINEISNGFLTSDFLRGEPKNWTESNCVQEVVWINFLSPSVFYVSPLKLVLQ